MAKHHLNGLPDEVARNVVGAFELAFVFQFDLSGNGGKRRVNIGDARHDVILAGEDHVVARVSDIYAALPAITGKIELEYEGELKGADNIARDLIRQAVQMVFRHYFPATDFKQVIEWFDLGGNIKLSDVEPAAAMLSRLDAVRGLLDKIDALGVM